MSHKGKNSLNTFTAQNTHEHQDFKEYGYTIIRGVLSAEEIAGLRTETLKICRGERGNFAGIEQRQEETEEQTLARYLCIHFPHKLSELVRHALKHPAIIDPLQKIIGPNIKCMQSMLFIKAPGKPGQAWHQDEFYIPTRDRSLTGAWIAMDSATIENGCLWVIPGSHKSGILYPQRPANSDDFSCSDESYQFPYQDSDSVPLTAEPGDVILFNGYLLHRSLKNTAVSGYRRSLVFHYMSAESFLPWLPQEGTHMAATDLRDIVMVSGRDPYPWKGTEDAMKPYLRPSGESGCGQPENHRES
jgi:ectoine hydroxylase-related dioxygenase (phytanoyl-CoA dioxygenase family)